MLHILYSESVFFHVPVISNVKGIIAFSREMYIYMSSLFLSLMSTNNFKCRARKHIYLPLIL